MVSVKRGSTACHYQDYHHHHYHYHHHFLFDFIIYLCRVHKDDEEVNIQNHILFATAE